MKLVLIDRDGVLNEELPYYVKSVSELAILKPALEGLALLKSYGFTCVVITNQSVVGRGIITPETLADIHRYLCETAEANGGNIAQVISCTDHPDQAGFRRKPRHGMLAEALEKYQARSESTPFIGDAHTDLEAALAAGCPRYLVMTGKGRKTAGSLSEDVKPVTLCRDMLEAAQRITETF